MNPSKSVLKEPILTDALHETGKIVNIHDVERGLACKCYCPKCNEPLVAKLGNKDGRQAPDFVDASP